MLAKNYLDFIDKLWYDEANVIQDSQNALNNLYKTRKEHRNNVSFAFLNVNSIRNKHESLYELVGEQIDILAIGETKLDDSFPSGQFSKKGFKNPYRLDHTANSGIMLYVRENLIAREITLNTLPNDIQIISLELTTGKWAFLFVYRQKPSQNLQYFLTTLADVLDYIYTKYEKVVIMGEFNCTV